jgi:hypothetical protein
MEGQEFGPLVKRAAKAKGVSQGRLGYLLTDDDGPFIDSSRVRLLYEGKWRLTHATVERLIGILAPYLDPAEAWAAAGLLPPGTTADHLRKLDLVASATNELTARSPNTIPLPVELDDPALLRRLGVPNLERRRAERRRRLRLVPQVEREMAA